MKKAWPSRAPCIVQKIIQIPFKEKRQNLQLPSLPKTIQTHNISKNFDLCGIDKFLLYKKKIWTLTWEDDCMTLPLLANPNKAPWKELRRELGREAMIKGNVPATQAALNNPASQDSILTLTQIKTKLHQP